MTRRIMKDIKTIERACSGKRGTVKIHENNSTTASKYINRFGQVSKPCLQQLRTETPKNKKTKGIIKKMKKTGGNTS